MRAGLLAAALALLTPAASAVTIGPAPNPPCGVETACLIGQRSYRIERPEGDDRIGAILFLHGYRASSAGTMANAALRDLARELGVALVAAQADGEDWTIPGVPHDKATDGAAEFAYFRALVRDLSHRHKIDRGRTLVVGFSAGGMMVWNLACHLDRPFGGYLAISGTFWEPVPEGCVLPAPGLIHVHGLADRVVPLEGRAIGDARQAPVAEAMAMYVRSGHFEVDPTVRHRLYGDRRTCAGWRSVANRILAFCTHPGGHDLDTGDIRRAWKVLIP